MKKYLILLIAFFITIGYAEAVTYIEDIKVTADNTGAQVVVSTSGDINYKVGKLPANKKIYVDFLDTVLREKKNISVGKGKLTTVRAAQNATTPRYISRVVFDLTEIIDFSEKLSDDRKQIIFYLGKAENIESIPAVPKKVIVLDPGHGGKDPGAVISDLYEKSLNLNIALKVQELLKNDERFTVIMTRSDDTFIELEDRAKVANDNKADLFVAIHNNSMPKGFKGVMTLYNDTSIKSNKDTAEVFQKNVSKALGKGSIGARQRTDLVVLKKIEVPGLLVEVACMTNIIERRALRTESFKEQAAESIYNSIVQTVIK